MIQKSTTKIQDHLDKFGQLAHELDMALDGNPLVEWGDSEGYYKTQRAKQMGLTITTQAAAERRGYRLKRNAKPIGTRYFRSPIKRDINIYILECHFIYQGDIPLRRPNVPQRRKIYAYPGHRLLIDFDATGQAPTFALKKIPPPGSPPETAMPELLLSGDDIISLAEATRQALNLYRNWQLLKLYESKQGEPNGS